MKSNETQLVKAALAYLKAMNFGVTWRQNVGSFAMTHEGKRRFVRFGMPGVSDIIGFAPDGKFFAAEAKIGNNKPTAVQRQFIESVRARGGVAFPFWSLEDLREELIGYGYPAPEVV